MTAFPPPPVPFLPATPLAWSRALDLLARVASEEMAALFLLGSPPPEGAFLSAELGARLLTDVEDTYWTGEARSLLLIAVAQLGRGEPFPRPRDPALELETLDLLHRWCRETVGAWAGRLPDDAWSELTLSRGQVLTRLLAMARGDARSPDVRRLPGR